MDQVEIYKQIKKLEKEYGRKKLKRFIYTVLFYAAVYFQICYLQGQLDGLPVGELIGEFLGCVFLSGIFVWFNSLIFSQLFNASQREKETIEYYEAELEKLKQTKE